MPNVWIYYLDSVANVHHVLADEFRFNTEACTETDPQNAMEKTHQALTSQLPCATHPARTQGPVQHPVLR